MMIYELKHKYSDEKVYIKSDLEIEEIERMIKSFQLLTYESEETFDLFPEEMAELLVKEKSSSYFTCSEDKIVYLYSIDLFDVGEDRTFNAFELNEMKEFDFADSEFPSSFNEIIENFIKKERGGQI